MATSWRVPVRHMAAQALRRAPMPYGKRCLANILGHALFDQSGPHHEISEVASRFRMCLDLRDIFQRQIYFTGAYDRHLTRLFTSLVEPGDVVVDGGANIGYYSLLSASCVGPRGAVHAFEPAPHAFEVLQDNVRLNQFSCVRSSPLALWREASDLTLEIPTDGTSGLGVDWAATVAVLGRGRLIKVQACALDAYAKTHHIEIIKLVKLDVEGSELAVLEGMTRLLTEQRVDYLVSEVNTFLLDALGIGPGSVLTRMHAHGYRCYAVGRRGHLHEVEGSDPAEPVPFGDYLFVRPGISFSKRRLMQI